MSQETSQDVAVVSAKKERTEAQKAADLRNFEKAKAAKEEKKQPIPYVYPPDDGAPEELQMMRHVFLNGSKFDKTQPQRIARDIQEKSPDRFMALKAQMEREFEEKKQAALKVATGETEVVGEDVGTDAAVGLARKLLKETVEEIKI